jgi:hypothetical protein
LASDACSGIIRANSSDELLVGDPSYQFIVSVAVPFTTCPHCEIYVNAKPPDGKNSVVVMVFALKCN